MPCSRSRSSSSCTSFRCVSFRYKKHHSSTSPFSDGFLTGACSRHRCWYVQISTLAYTFGVTLASILLVLSTLAAFGVTRTILAPLVGAIANREVLSITVILGSIVCVVFCVLFLVSSALHDLANGTRSLYNYLLANAYAEDNTSAPSFIMNHCSLCVHGMDLVVVAIIGIDIFVS
jgi:hypothetical protein